MKAAAARLLGVTLLDRALLAAQRRARGGAFVRAVYYHGTPTDWADSFERHLSFYRQHFDPVGPDDLAALLENGRWPRARPGLILSFDDGLRNNYDVARPMLERHGFIGWFFIPTDFVDAPAAEQEAFARAHSIHPSWRPEGDGRIAMTWEEIRALSRGHVVGCHTRSHRRLGASAPVSSFPAEVHEAKAILEARLERTVESFCWVGGEEHAISLAAAEAVRSAGYRFAFMTASQRIARGTDALQLHRTNMEANWPLSLVRFQLCGIADCANAGKRRRIRAMLAGG